ncbi:MAG: hypothetical protein RMK51_00230 [Meiothermus sp.]|uniref:hypothetical protein n=1 Tax=Meiothermus sp. TaxID=1955249 RepID=UPI0025F8D8AF|nr:hypothetical protein [Meiothermus sp.]MCS7069235.1 hypothetical protein [Meiothermus sp.]MDW8424331.1 hypothetical protein [Meiothermus sp.]
MSATTREYNELPYRDARLRATRQMADGYGEALVLQDEHGFWGLYYFYWSQEPPPEARPHWMAGPAPALPGQDLAGRKRLRDLPEQPGLSLFTPPFSCRASATDRPNQSPWWRLSGEDGPWVSYDTGRAITELRWYTP